MSTVLARSLAVGLILLANDGKTLYVVDYGELYVDFSMPSPFFQTPKSSVIWKVTYTGN